MLITSPYGGSTRMPTKIIALLLCLLAAAPAFSQTIDEPKPAQDPAALQKEAIAFLRETMSDINTMRSLENRISFTAELAGLMWFHDEREARAMYATVFADFRQLLLNFDGQLNAFGDEPVNTSGGGGFFGAMIEPTERGRIEQKLSTAMAVRQQIASSIAEHDPDLAFGFYRDSLSAISNAKTRQQFEANGAHFENQLLMQIAETNPAKAVQFGLKSLEMGVAYSNVELLKKLHSKDPDRAAEYASALLGKVKTEDLKSSDFWAMNSFLEFAAETVDASRKPKAKKAVLSQAEMRELADSFGKAILEQEPVGEYGIYIDQIEKFAPARAAKVRAHLGYDDAPGNRAGTAFTSNTNAAHAAALAALTDPYAGSTSLANSSVESAQDNLAESISKLGSKEFPKERREQIVNQARQIIMQTPGRMEKLVGLSGLAAQVAKLGDKQLAAEIMRDAEQLMSHSPKTYQDFLSSWMVATGYASTDPDRAFTLLDETIGRANQTIDAFVKVGEFIDVAEQMIIDGEVQVGAFGGGMVRGLTGELGMADATIRVLANADFVKTKNLTNRFDRPEVRILAKMMVLRAVLEKKVPEQKSEEGEMVDVNSNY